MVNDNSLEESESYMAPSGKPQFPEPPPYDPPQYTSQSTQVNQQVQPIEMAMIGGIGHSSGVKVEKKEDNAKKKKTIYLPPGFMKGVL